MFWEGKIMLDKKEYDRNYYIEHKEEKKERSNRWRKDNPDRMKKLIGIWYRNHPEKRYEYTKRWKKNNTEKIKEIDRRWSKNNPEKIKTKNKKYYIENRERLLEYFKQWNKDNYEKIRKYKREYIAMKIKIDPKFNLNHRMRTAIAKSLKGNKKGRRWEDLVGYTLSNLMKRLKKTIPKDYTWQDYLGGRLHIDHIIPISAFNFTRPEHSDFKRCWALNNLQLLSAKENIAKSNKLERIFQSALKI